MLGYFPLYEKGGDMYIAYLIDYSLREPSHEYVISVDQQVRAAILIILVSTIILNNWDFIKLDELMSLQIIDKVKDYAQESLRLVYVYRTFDDVSQMTMPSLGSLSFIWEL